MHRDLSIALLVSILVHVGTLYGDRFINLKAKLQPKRVAETTLDLVVMPQIEADDIDRPLAEPDDVKLTFEAPQQIDLPQLVAEGFVQPLQPLPADRLRLNATALEIPGDAILRKYGNLDIFDPKNLDQIPQTRFRSSPNYPFEMRRSGIEGEVLVDFLVDIEGDVQNARALHSSNREFENAAVQAVAKWKFRPGRKNGQNVVTHMQVPIQFSLDAK
jgi:periplasmic protein TonB